PARGGIDAHILSVEFVFVVHFAPGAAQQRAYAGEQLGQPERFGDVVVRPSVQADDQVNLFSTRGQDQHRNRQTLIADRSAHIQSVNIGQPEVEHHKVRLAGRVDRFLAGGAVVYVVAFPVQGAGERFSNGEVVFCQKYTSHSSIISGSFHL